MYFATLTILKNCYCSLLCIDLIGVYNIAIKLNIFQFHSYFMKLKIHFGIIINSCGLQENQNKG